MLMWVNNCPAPRFATDFRDCVIGLKEFESKAIVSSLELLSLLELVCERDLGPECLVNI